MSGNTNRHSNISKEVVLRGKEAELYCKLKKLLKCKMFHKENGKTIKKEIGKVLTQLSRLS